MSNHNLLLNIDPGKKTGWAVYENGLLQSHGSFRFSVKDAADLVLSESPDVLFVEDTHCPNQNTKRKKDGTLSSSISFQQAAWRTLAELYDIKYEPITDSTWKKFHGYPPKGKISREQSKNLSLEKASEIDPVTDDNEAEAILLGAYTKEK